jgi:hypothetical protein
MESRDPDVCYRANLFAFAVQRVLGNSTSSSIARGRSGGPQ